MSARVFAARSLARALRNPVMRGCPACLREDAQAHQGNPLEFMAMRGDWQLREVSYCLRHRQPLVPLWSERVTEKRFDIGARLQENIEDLLSEALDQPMLRVKQSEIPRQSV